MKLFPNTDPEELRGWLDRRSASLKRERDPHEAGWKTLSEHYEPDLGRSLFGPWVATVEELVARDIAAFTTRRLTRP